VFEPDCRGDLVRLVADIPSQSPFSERREANAQDDLTSMQPDSDTHDDARTPLPVQHGTSTQDEPTTLLPAVPPTDDDTSVLPPVPAEGPGGVHDETDVLPPVPEGAGMPDVISQGGEDESPVFSDHTGRRRKFAQRAGVALAALGTGYLVMLVVSLLGGPTAPGVPVPGGGDPAPAKTPTSPPAGTPTPTSRSPEMTTSGPSGEPTSTPTSSAPPSTRPTNSPSAPTSPSLPTTSKPTTSKPTSTSTQLAPTKPPTTLSTPSSLVSAPSVSVTLGSGPASS
jgi:hypothetical protein